MTEIFAQLCKFIALSRELNFKLYVISFRIIIGPGRKYLKKISLVRSFACFNLLLFPNKLFFDEKRVFLVSYNLFGIKEQ